MSEMNKSIQNQKTNLLAYISLGGLLAVGMIIAALLLTNAAKQFANANQSITVKGTAEKEVKADKAIWKTSITVFSDSVTSALPTLQQHVAHAQKELSKSNIIKPEQLTISDWTSTPEYEDYKDANGDDRRRLKGYSVSQNIGAVFNDVTIPEKLNQVVNQLILENIDIAKADTQYLVSNIENVKLSLIASATKNASDRAAEFAKSGNVNVGNMRSASQGVFQVSAPLSTGSDEYGGEYDTSTIDKVARVVVTVNYGIK